MPAIHLTGVVPDDRRRIEQLVEIWNWHWPAWAQTADELHRVVTTNADPHWLWLAEHEGLGIAMAHLRQASIEPARFELGLCVLPDWRRQGVGGRLYRQVLAHIAPQLPAVVNVMTSEDWHDAIAAVEHYGFQLRMRQAQSEYDLGNFDSAPYQPLLDRIAAEGFRIVSVEQLMAEQGADPVWHQLYELHNTLYRDVPTVEDEWQPYPVEAWIENRRDSPTVLLDGWFVALFEGQMVAVSRVSKHATDNELLIHGLTGTVRSYRRRGLATALKVRVLGYAQEQGIKVIRTDNAEDNPMYALNLSLGYRPLPALLLYEKRVEA